MRVYPVEQARQVVPPWELSLQNAQLGSQVMVNCKRVANITKKNSMVRCLVSIYRIINIS
jgi:hypothetical protein